MSETSSETESLATKANAPGFGQRVTAGLVPSPVFDPPAAHYATVHFVMVHFVMVHFVMVHFVMVRFVMVRFVMVRFVMVRYEVRFAPVGHDAAADRNEALVRYVAAVPLARGAQAFPLALVHLHESVAHFVPV
jgi:hypothetical protein